MLPLLTILLIVALLCIVGVWGLNRIGGRVIYPGVVIMHYRFLVVPGVRRCHHRARQ